MQSTLPRLKLYSTRGGQRRILKKKPPLLTYLRQAVEAGTYRTNEELDRVWKERIDGQEDLSVIMRRFRQDIVRGTSVHDYPDEYLILQQHPPFSDPPRVPKKYLRSLPPKPDPVKSLVQRYLQKQPKGATLTTDQYYHHLLGVPKPSLTAALGHKTAAIQQAYAKAVKHYELERSGMDSSKAMEQVEELLAQAKKDEAKLSRERLERVQQWQQEQTTTQTDNRKATRSTKSTTVASGNDDNLDEPVTTDEPTSDAEELPNAFATVFTDRPLVAQGLLQWNNRVRAVPYHEWTIGARSSLDHWLARQVLGWSEATWLAVLEGQEEGGPQLVQVREWLFPETKLEVAEEEHPDESGDSIEDLLASLGSLSKSKPGRDWMSIAPADKDAEVAALVEKLQEWRAVEGDYDSWTSIQQSECDDFVKKFVATVASQAEESTVDLVATRKALLKGPPVSKEESDEFWDPLSEEYAAVQLLDRMRADGAPPGARVLDQAFWDMSYDDQLKRLLQMGAIRPLLDEYTKDSDKTKFLQQYSELLLEGVPLEHLVVDPSGPIRMSDLGLMKDKLDLPETTRFRVEVLPYHEGDDRMRALFREWNTFKAGRANYEEKLFQSGRLGLQYPDKKASKTDDSEKA